jgi:ATP-dependent DNA helicase RecG
VDVPEATVMLIVHAERFGLAQLHQLRGRIGRGGKDAFCILLTTPEISKLINQGMDEEEMDDDVSRAAKRLNIMVQTSDGFRIAEVDLELRGPGDFFGTKQHGTPSLRIANLIRDRKWLDIAHKEATYLLEKDPSLKDHHLLRESLLHYFKEYKGFPTRG